MVFRGMALGCLSPDVELLVDAGPKSQKPACAGLRLPFREENNLVGALTSRAEILNRKSRTLRNRYLIILSAVSDHNCTTRRETRGAFDALSVYSAAWALLTHVPYAALPHSPTLSRSCCCVASCPSRAYRWPRDRAHGSAHSADLNRSPSGTQLACDRPG